MASRERERMETPTDALIAATEEADNFQYVAIIAERVDGSVQFFWTRTPALTMLGMLEFARVDVQQIIEAGLRDST